MAGEGLRSAMAGTDAVLTVRCKDRFGNTVDADKRTRMWIELKQPRVGRRVSGEAAAVASTAAASLEAWEEGESRGLQSCEAMWADDGLMELRYLTTRAGLFDVVLWCEHEGESARPVDWT